MPVLNTAWACVENLAEIATAVPGELADLWIALKYRSLHNDLENNLVLAAAQRSKATLLVTNDEKLLKHSPVAALDVRDALSWLHTQKTC